MKTDISIHFTTKGQTVAEINAKFNDYDPQTKKAPNTRCFSRGMN
jgi:hypothetical protein